MKKPFLTLIFVTFVFMGTAAVTFALQTSLPATVSGSDFIDCIEKLTAQGSGWCEIRHSKDHPSISSVWPELDGRTRMVTGPISILIAWNSAAFDEENLILYFFGGGHADYGGNEVYAFSLLDAKWKRLTNPSPLGHLYQTDQHRYCWIPDLQNVPASTHTYDGLEFNPHTKTLFLMSKGIANGSCFTDPDITDDDPRLIAGKAGGIYEFNPSEKQARNGLPPLTWRRVSKHKYSYPRLAFGPVVLAGSRTSLFSVDPVSFKEIKKHSQIADWGDGTLIYDEKRNWFWSIHGKIVMAFDPSGRKTFELKQTVPHGKSGQINKDGLLISWDGGCRIIELDVEKKQFRVLDWAGFRTRRGDGRVYGKWRYVDKYDVFVGLSNHETGVWVYKHPAGRAIPIAEQSAQQLINKASVGDTVTIPPGIYYTGIKIDKSLTVNLDGVRLDGVYGGKAVVNVNCSGCRVTINDLQVNGPPAGCITGNCAGIKMEGISPEVIVNRAHIDNTVMGILTDNRGGTLIVNDSLIENTGLNDRSRTLGHGLYAGHIDRVEFNNSIIRNVNSQGHLFKSRAPDTRIRNSRLEGLNGRHSRSIDYPCGGNLVIQDSFINHGKNTDNVDMISIGTEPESCPDGIQPSSVEIENTVFVVDRKRNQNEPAWNGGETGLFNWHAPYVSEKVAGNKFVIHPSAGWKWNYGPQEIPDHTAENRFCRTKQACGI